jgi:hypothetical protein
MVHSIFIKVQSHRQPCLEIIPQKVPDRRGYPVLFNCGKIAGVHIVILQDIPPVIIPVSSDDSETVKVGLHCAGSKGPVLIISGLINSLDIQVFVVADIGGERVPVKPVGDLCC